MTLWIDTDMGFDDFWAVAMVAAEREIAGMSLGFGNTELPIVKDNAARAAAFAGWHWPVHVGADKAVLGNRMDASHVLGPTGMTSRGRQLPNAAALPATQPAQAALAAWLEGLEEPGTILALGPLTNIAILLLARPDLHQRIGQLVWMGGSAGPGNQTASAEFNAAADPEALAIVMVSGVPLRMIDLEICRQVLLAPDDLSALQALAGERAAILADLAGGYVDIAIQRGRSAMALYDPVAAAAMLRPEMFGFAGVRLDVELAGAKTRGQTIVDRRHGQPRNAEIAIEVDVAAVHEMAMAALVQLAAP